MGMRSSVPQDVAAVDIEDQATWPLDVRQWVDDQARRLRGTTRFALDLDLHAEDEFRNLLSNRMVRAYHCTRLLPHEVDAVARGGLRLLSADFVVERLAQAESQGYLTSAQRVALQRDHLGNASNRRNQVCLLLGGNHAFEHDVAGVWNLLSRWGGEAINFSHAGNSMVQHLQNMGLPTIVVARIDLNAGWRVHGCAPPLDRAFVGARLGLGDPVVSVHYRDAVPPHHIDDIWQPGHPEYDAHSELPAPGVAME